MPKIYDTAKVSPRTQLLISDDCSIGDYVFVSCRKLVMLKGAQVNAHTSITGSGDVVVGQDSVVAYGCRLLTATDTPKAKKMNDASPRMLRAVLEGHINIGSDCFIGSNSVIMPGVTVHDGAVVGALSYVKAATIVQPWSIGWGTPYQFKRSRHPTEVESQ